jgi:A/G-specific adenine glycosylase
MFVRLNTGAAKLATKEEQLGGGGGHHKIIDTKTDMSTQHPTAAPQQPWTKAEKPLREGLFGTLLARWYQVHKRDLPWRKTSDPYKIWLSEIILQQTRIAQGLPYYERFIEKYPTIQDLAHASEEEVLRLWQGLGYYTRARNLHACARTVTEELDGKFPATYNTLLQLKGVGKYTAGAIASIAFKEVVAVVDGNVYRVLARVFGVAEEISSTQGVKAFDALAKSLVPQQESGMYSQAIMEFGAMHCTPANPKCASCIFQDHCVAFRTKRQGALPVKSKKIRVKKRFLNYLVLAYAGKIYMKRREKGDIWKGLYDFYLVESNEPRGLNQLEDALAALLQRHKLLPTGKSAMHKHLLTHQQLHVHFFHVQVTAQFIQEAVPLLEQAGISAFTIKRTMELPKPILVANFLREKFYV